jgi:hypothetical protein
MRPFKATAARASCVCSGPHRSGVRQPQHEHTNLFLYVASQQPFNSLLCHANLEYLCTDLDRIVRRNRKPGLEAQAAQRNAGLGCNKEEV